MCNLYHLSPRGDVERYLGQVGRLAPRGLGPWPANPVVGPFGQGVFLRAGEDELLSSVLGQWGLIRPGQRERIEHLPGRTPGSRGRPRSTNNARAESVHSKPTFRAAWAAGQRCLVPALWYQEPNWETGKNIWWQLRRADGLPWMLAGLWSEWIDPATGEVLPNFTLLTVNCDHHPLLNRLHKPDPSLPPGAQDKRSLVHLEPAQWGAWLQGSADEARSLLQAPPEAMFDLADARRTDDCLRQQASLL